MNLYHALGERFSQFPEKPLLEIDDGTVWRYADIDQLSNAYAHCLAENGLEAPQRVLVQVDKSPYALALYLACLRLGLVFVPLNTAYTATELEYFVEDLEPALVVSTKTRVCKPIDGYSGLHMSLGHDGSGDFSVCLNVTFAPLLIDRAIDDVAVIVYTSGTTGRSKGAMLSNQNLLSNATALHQTWQWNVDDVLLHALPIFHVHGLFISFHCALLGGSTIKFLSHFDVEKICTQLPNSTVMMGVPTYYTRLLNAAQFSSKLCENMRLFVSGSAPLLQQTFKQFELRSGHKILERYGMSETNIITSNPVDGERIAGSVGYALPGVTMRVANDQEESLDDGSIGQVQVKGDSVFSGYWRRPDLAETEFTVDGFFRTGDLGRLDPDGRLFLGGRDKDLIISGGLNVYPAEVEAYIDAIEGIEEAAVVGAAHDDFGEQVIAFVVASKALDKEASAALVAKIQQVLSSKIANFKRPKSIHLIEALPRNTMGKVQKNILRNRFNIE